MEDGFSLRDLYADVRFRLTQCDFLPGNKLRLHAGFLSKYQTMRGTALPTHFYFAHVYIGLIFVDLRRLKPVQVAILEEIRKRIQKIKRFTNKVTVRCIGHSLGGALAMINAADLAHYSAENEWDDQIEVSCCTFGAPAAGNRAFVNYFDATVKESTRVTVEDDPIIYLPPFPWFSVRLFTSVRLKSAGLCGFGDFILYFEI